MNEAILNFSGLAARVRPKVSGLPAVTSGPGSVALVIGESLVTQAELEALKAFSPQPVTVFLACGRESPGQWGGHVDHKVALSTSELHPDVNVPGVGHALDEGADFHWAFSEKPECAVFMAVLMALALGVDQVVLAGCSLDRPEDGQALEQLTDFARRFPGLAAALHCVAPDTPLARAMAGAAPQPQTEDK